MEQPIPYSEIIREYFREWDRSVFMMLMAFMIVFSINDDFNISNFMVSIPVLTAMLSGASHTVSLKTMMYYVPYNRQMREQYIQRMLQVKVMLPIAAAFVVDLPLICLLHLDIKAVILQIISIFFITYLTGILNDSSVFQSERKTAQAGLKYYSGAILVLCYLFGGVMALIVFSEEISVWEFWIVLLAMLAVFGTISIYVCKLWKTIRENYADYEMAANVEVQGRGW